MRTIVISMQNNLLSGAIVKYLIERGELMPERVLDHSKRAEPYATCQALDADVLLMEISRLQYFTLDKRLETARKVKEDLPKCKIALLCDEHADPDIAEKVKNAKMMGLIDGFFHSSVTGEYISAALDAL